MRIILNQNYPADRVVKTEQDDKNTRIIAGTWILSPEIYEKITSFLTEKATNVTQNRKAG